jgi:hypothetical protein
MRFGDRGCGLGTGDAVWGQGMRFGDRSNIRAGDAVWGQVKGDAVWGQVKYQGIRTWIFDLSLFTHSRLAFFSAANGKQK